MKRKKAFRFLWITDPWRRLDHAADTSLRLAAEACLQGYENYWADVRTIRLVDGKVLLDACPLESAAGTDSPSSPGSMTRGSFRTAEPLEFDSLQYRTDPPVDLAYLQPLQLLNLGVGRSGRSEIVNPAESLFAASEKTEGALLDRFVPPGVVASQWEVLENFGRREGRTVLKPLHLAQSKGVELLKWSSKADIARSRELLARTTDDFQRPVLLQRFLEAIEDGERRLWFLDGKLLAYVAKLPLKGDFRVDVDRGSALTKVRLKAREKHTATRISRHLKSRGIRLAAVDLIGGYVTDFNITSPGLLCQMEKILGENLARPIVLALSRR